MYMCLCHVLWLNELFNVLSLFRVDQVSQSFDYVFSPQVWPHHLMVLVLSLPEFSWAEKSDASLDTAGLVSYNWFTLLIIKCGSGILFTSSIAVFYSVHLKIIMHHCEYILQVQTEISCELIIQSSVQAKYSWQHMIELSNLYLKYLENVKQPTIYK